MALLKELSAPTIVLVMSDSFFLPEIGSYEMYLFSNRNILDLTACENILHNDTLDYRRVTNNTAPSILFLALNKNEQSWSSNFRESRGTVYGF